ncbi:MAG: VWA domain-containing protein [Acidobacteriia bacterium]|nr:VWA domain-containing protein [Terriglobia bacterium]
MRLWKVFALCVTALIVVAGILIGQEQQGPNRDPGATVARPRQPGAPAGTAPAPDNGNDADLPKIPSRLGKKGQPDTTGLATFKSDVSVVTVDVAVTDPKGHFIPGLPPSYFRVLEDNVPQQIKSVTAGEAPMTVAMVIEFSARFQQFWGPTWYQTLTAAYGFAQSLKPDDYLAIVAYDLRSEILSDFTNDRQKTQEALQRLNIPGFSEANLYDALTDTADRMSGIEGRKAIVLISSGIDTFSKKNYGETRKILQETGVPVYAIGLMQALRDIIEARGGLQGPAGLDFLQADNAMRTFAKETGGMAFFPRFMGEFPTIFQQIHQALRSQYVITYEPSNKAHDGTYRKIKVELVNPTTNEALAMKDDKSGKPIKYQIIAKAGYKAPREVE